MKFISCFKEVCLFKITWLGIIECDGLDCYNQNMIGIVDYKAGNIKSLERALEAIKAPFILSDKAGDFKDCDRLIFPGVGDASYSMKQLKATGFDSFLKDWAACGKPLMGICLGSQIIFEYSQEGDTECLGLLKGKIISLSQLWKERQADENEKKELGHEIYEHHLKTPHMGWNDVTFCNNPSHLLGGVKSGSDFYFVHSYVIQPQDPLVIKGYASYGTMIPAVIEKDNIIAFQFHPEKSGKTGLKLLKNFADLSVGEKNA